MKTLCIKNIELSSIKGKVVYRFEEGIEYRLLQEGNLRNYYGIGNIILLSGDGYTDHIITKEQFNEHFKLVIK